MEQETKQLTIAIIDYGMGNIRSVRNALELLHCEPRIFDEPEGLIDVDAIVLPGVYISGTTNYGSDIIAAFQHKHIFGVQFHPERSQRKGLRLLQNFLNFVKST